MAMTTPRSTRPGVPAQKPATAPAAPPPPTRTRTVKRYVATCLLTEIPGVATDCEFIDRPKKQPHETRAAAVVEAIRHLRAAHENDLVIERQAKRTVQVQRTLLGEELVD